MKYNANHISELSMENSHGRILNQIAHNSTVLELGCATGYMTEYMKNRLGCQVHIVERDKESFDVALQYAQDGICTDLMSDGWVKKFNNIRFDYVLFVDVLEHLYDPLVVLQKAVSLMRDEGKVLVSLPNVGHNDIVMKLIDNEWDYTPLGLLDDTHIRFWGQKNLDPFFKQAGLSIVVKDCTLIPTAKTEQFANSRFLLDEETYGILKRRTGGEVYQFILTAQKTSVVEKNGVVPQNTNRYTCSSFSSKLSLLDFYMEKQQYEERCAQYEERCAQYEERCAQYEERCAQYEERCKEVEEKFREFENAYKAISESTSWRLTKPFQLIADKIRRVTQVHDK